MEPPVSGREQEWEMEMRSWVSPCEELEILVSFEMMRECPTHCIHPTLLISILVSAVTWKLTVCSPNLLLTIKAQVCCANHSSYKVIYPHPSTKQLKDKPKA